MWEIAALITVGPWFKSRLSHPFGHLEVMVGFFTASHLFYDFCLRPEESNELDHTVILRSFGLTFEVKDRQLDVHSTPKVQI